MSATLKTMLATALLAILALSTLVGCDQAKFGVVSLGFQGTNNGVLARSFSARSSAPQGAVDIAIGGGVLRLDRATIAVREIEFELDLDKLPAAEQERYPESVDEWEFAGSYTVDLLTGGISPSLGDVTLPAGPYEEVELKLAGANSISLGGMWYPTGTGGAGVPFALAYSGSQEIDLKPPSEIANAVDMQVDEAARNSILIACRMNEWFAGITLPASGNVVVSEAMLKTFIANFIKSMDYGEDLNGDGILSEAEDDDL